MSEPSRETHKLTNSISRGPMTLSWTMQRPRRPSSSRAVATCIKIGCAHSMSGCRVDLRGRYLCSAHGMAAERHWKRELPVVHKWLSRILEEHQEYQWILGCLTDDLTNQLLKWTSKELSDPDGLWIKPPLPQPNPHKTGRHCAPARAFTRGRLAARCSIHACNAILKATRRSWGE